MSVFRTARGLLLVAISCAASASAATARAEGVPQPVELPAKLSLDEAVQLLRTRSLDILIAEAAVKNAEGDVKVAGAVPNPEVSIAYGHVFNYPPAGCGPGCSPNQYTVGVADQAAIEDSLSGKRELRLKVARNALAAAKLSRADAQRTVEFQVKSSYAQLAQAQRALDFAKEVQTTNVLTLEKFQVKKNLGQINAADFARIQTQKLEADQAVDQALDSLRQARVALAFLLGLRGPVPEFGVDDHVLDFSVPHELSAASPDRLLRDAFAHRPDLVAQGYTRASAEAQIELARRQRFPDITGSVQYTQTGTSSTAVQPPTLIFGLSAPIPVFYQLQGEIRKAEANYDQQSVQQAKTTALVVSDVSAAEAAFRTTRALVERMEKALKPSADEAYHVTQAQYDRGGAQLIDLLDAQRTFIAVNVEYIQDLTNYWTAVFQLEEAVGMELRP